jgi:hypothetical protein
VQLSETAETLARLDCFPAYPNLKALLQRFQLDHVYSVDMVRQAINALLQRAQPFLSVAGCEVQESSNCFTDPEVLSAYDERLRDSAERLLASVTGASSLLATEAKRIGFVALGIPHSGHFSLFVRCDIERISTSLDTSRLFCPMGSLGEVALAWSYEDLLTRLGPDEVWDNATANREVHLAIALEALRLLRTSDATVSLKSLPRFDIGSRFYDSLLRNGAGPYSRFGGAVRETCARLILGAAKYEVKELLTSRGGKRAKMQPRVRADGSPAFRTHISKHHEALRLMFWQRPGGRIELANIGPKAELQIEPGLPDQRITESW